MWSSYSWSVLMESSGSIFHLILGLPVWGPGNRHREFSPVGGRRAWVRVVRTSNRDPWTNRDPRVWGYYNTWTKLSPGILNMEGPFPGLAGEDINSRTLEDGRSSPSLGLIQAMAVTVDKMTVVLSSPYSATCWQRFWRTYILVESSLILHQAS
jgi:hypothetical protein